MIFKHFFLDGVIAGSFDVIHPGYMSMFRDAKQHCSHLTVALQTDPTVERPNKLKPLLSYEDREMILRGIRYIDKVIPYTTEKELRELLERYRFKVRILGEDYRGKYATGQEFSDSVVYVGRDHGWSTTRFKTAIYEQMHATLKKDSGPLG